MTEQPQIFEGNPGNFNDLVVENSIKGPVLVNYWAPGAGPSIRLYPILDKLGHEYAGKFLLVNVDAAKHKELAGQFGVNSLPTMKMFRNRVVDETLNGHQTESELRKIIEKYIVRDSDVVVSKAVKVYHKGDADSAFMQLAEVAMADPTNLRIPLTLSKLLTRDARPEQELLATIASDPDNCEVCYQLGATKLIADDYGGAMSELPEIVIHDNDYKNQAGRKGLVAIFSLLGNAGELVERHRALMIKTLN